MQFVFASFQWRLQQPTSGSKFSLRAMDYVQQAVCSRGLRLAVVLDGAAPPPWLAKLFPDGSAASTV